MAVDRPGEDLPEKPVSSKLLTHEMSIDFGMQLLDFW